MSVDTKTMKVVAVVTIVVAATGIGTRFALAGTSTGVTSAPSIVATTTTGAPTAEVAQDVESVTTTSTSIPAAVDATAVRTSQQKLFDAGYWMSAVDGKLGGTTEQAVMAFQKLQGLPRTGKLDTATVAAIAGVTRPAAPAGSGDFLAVDKAHQVIFVVRGGATQWVFNTSTGTEKSYVTNGNRGFAHTPTGTFAVSRTVDAVDPGPLGPLYRPRYFTNTGIAVHGAGSIPAYPASHGCARVSNAAMDFIWANNIMPKGSLVWVFDDASKQPFAAPKPATTTTTAAPTTTVAPTTTSSTTSTTLAPTTVASLIPMPPALPH